MVFGKYENSFSCCLNIIENYLFFRTILEIWINNNWTIVPLQSIYKFGVDFSKKTKKHLRYFLSESFPFIKFIFLYYDISVDVCSVLIFFTSVYNWWPSRLRHSKSYSFHSAIYFSIFTMIWFWVVPAITKEKAFDNGEGLLNLT